MEEVLADQMKEVLLPPNSVRECVHPQTSQAKVDSACRWQG